MGGWYLSFYSSVCLSLLCLSIKGNWSIGTTLIFIYLWIFHSCFTDKDRKLYYNCLPAQSYSFIQRLRLFDRQFRRVGGEVQTKILAYQHHNQDVWIWRSFFCLSVYVWLKSKGITLQRMVWIRFHSTTIMWVFIYVYIVDSRIYDHAISATEARSPDELVFALAEEIKPTFIRCCSFMMCLFIRYDLLNCKICAVMLMLFSTSWLL